ncbi:hypothetical protein E2C01_081442 [Portunus trituberculatus]|uniref:Uncharacterized protein n=1 Tax=Portunus trituberculatus TaxID=210409 RepID=A0A5B7J158_PORTR|nr:hypothetical protein [Portunus trituberculatus]
MRLAGRERCGPWPGLSFPSPPPRPLSGGVWAAVWSAGARCPAARLPGMCLALLQYSWLTIEVLQTATNMVDY